MKTLIAMADNVLLSLAEYRRGAAIVGALLWISQALFGAFTPRVVGTVVVLLLVDWILGTVRAGVERKASEPGAIQGLVKLIIYMALLAVTTLLVRVELGSAWQAITTALVSFVGASIIVTEAISVLQHLRWFADRAGVRVPILDLVLSRLQREADRLGGGPQL